MVTNNGGSNIALLYLLGSAGRAQPDQQGVEDRLIRRTFRGLLVGRIWFS